MELKHITREEWVAALRSHKYKQGKSQLKSENFSGKTRFCCLGVACDLAGLDWSLFSFHRLATSSFAIQVDNAPGGYAGKPYPALDLFANLGLSDSDACALAVHNDRGDTFEEIADEIERMPVRALDSEWLERCFPYAVEANEEVSI